MQLQILIKSFVCKIYTDMKIVKLEYSKKIFQFMTSIEMYNTDHPTLNGLGRKKEIGKDIYFQNDSKLTQFPNGLENITCIMMYGEPFYDHHTPQHQLQ